MAQKPFIAKHGLQVADNQIVDLAGNVYASDLILTGAIQRDVGDSPYATETYVTTAISLIPPTDFTGYATELYVDSAISTAAVGYATAGQGTLADSALQADDLVGYATETYVDDAIALKDNTDEISEGSTNLYYTDARVETKIDSYVTAGTGVSINSGAVSIGQSVGTTDNVQFGDITSSGNVQIDGNLVVSGTTTTIVADNLAVHDNMIYLNNAIQTTITDAVGDGTDVVYTTQETHNYSIGMTVTITGVDPVAYNLSSQLITDVTTNTFTIENSATGTYVSGGTARAKVNSNPDLGWAAGRYDGGYGHAGVFRDASDGIFKFFDGYTPEPDESAFIDTAHASFALAPVQAQTFKADSYLKWNSTTSEWEEVGANAATTGKAIAMAMVFG